jgi:hypothetical protein
MKWRVTGGQAMNQVAHGQAVPIARFFASIPETGLCPSLVHNGGSRALLITVVGDVFGFVQVSGSLAALGVA